MNYKFFSHLVDDAKMIRQTVFIEEQGFKEEFDEIDKSSMHLVIYLKNIPVATARLYQNNRSSEHIIGRVAVLSNYRKEHLGAKLIQLMETKAIEIGATKISLSAQYNVKGFYEKQNYKVIGSPYFEEHCEHIKMEKEMGAIL